MTGGALNLDFVALTYFDHISPEGLNFEGISLHLVSVTVYNVIMEHNYSLS